MQVHSVHLFVSNMNFMLLLPWGDLFYAGDFGLLSWKWRHFPPKDGAGSPWRWRLFPWKWRPFPQRARCPIFLKVGTFSPERWIHLYSWLWGPYPLGDRAVFPEDGGIFPKRLMFFLRKWRHFPPEDGAGFPWRWSFFFTAKDGCLFSRKRRPFPQGDRGLYFPESGGLFS